MIGWTSLAVIFVFWIIIIRNGIETGTEAGVTIFVFAFVVAFAFAFAGTVAGAFDYAGAFAFIVAFAFGFAIAFAGVFALTVAFAFAFAGAIAGPFAVAFALFGALFGVIYVAKGFTKDFAFNSTIGMAFAIGIALAGAIVFAQILLNSYIAYRVIKGDEKYALIRRIAIAFAAIGGTSFRDANLTDADFTNAILKNTDFRDANLTQTLWKKTNKLDLARPGKSVLAQSKLRELLVSGKGLGQDFSKADLRGANLSNADLSYTNLTQADLSQATLYQANLEGANLTEINVIGTDLKQATLTAACIEAWNTDSTTRLDEIHCDYIYLLNHQQERRPSSGIFAPGEFTKLFEEVFNTVDLIFQDGVNWKAFVSAFKQLQVENEGTELTVQSIENKGDGVIVVKVEVPLNADKEKIHSDFHQNYELKLQALEREYKTKLQIKDSEIESYKRENVNMIEVIKLLASRQIEVKNMASSESSAEKSTKQVEVEMNFQNEVTGVGGKVKKMIVNQKQKLADSVVEVQELLQILDHSYPGDLPTDTQTEIEVAVRGIEKDPALKQRLISALKSGSKEALKELMDNPYVNILVATYEGWQNP
ncbi:MAG: pentapeptide repeat-containing protein [Okeania sp. SIO2C2]|nr:pentapeptide repeat-containing protein [Okeania sp. SIO2C2]